MEQLAHKEFIEFKLMEIAKNKDHCMVRFFVFGTVELCLFGELSMDFEQKDSTPFFWLQHPKQYAMNIRFYGSDIQRVTNVNGVVEIYLGQPIKNGVDNSNTLA